MQDPLVLRARQRVLFHIFKKGRNYRVNISNVARDLKASDGNMNQYVHDLQNVGYLRVVRRREGEFFRVTRRGQISLFPVILPRLIAIFITVFGSVLVALAVPEVLARNWVLSTLELFAVGLTLIGLSVLLLWAVLRMEDNLLESKWSSSG